MIRVLDYNPSWRDDFAAEAKRVGATLSSLLVRVHHIGSTAIPTTKAKPIIDILLEVTSLAALDEKILEMEHLGYEAMGEYGIPGRRYFRRNNSAGIRTHHVHGFEVGAPHVLRHLAFRDYLLAHPPIARDYGKLKERLVAAHPSDEMAYVDGKDAFIKDHQSRALAWTSDTSTCRLNRRGQLIELPIKEPCDLCEGIAGREERWAVVDESEHTLTVINPCQFEVGQCCVITRRHVATLLDLSDQECGAIAVSAKRVAEALVKTYRPLGILTFQNNGVFSGQETPHFHFHVVPRQKGSDWGVGPPQLATFDSAGRQRGSSHDPSGDAQRRERVQVSAKQLTETADLIRLHLPE